MPDLILENVPQELYDDLRRAAEAHQRSLADEALDRLKTKHSRRHLPDEPSLTEETPANCTIPLPGEGRPVKTRPGEPHLPDPPWITTGDR
jgi:plasmid stability protein